MVSKNFELDLQDFLREQEISVADLQQYLKNDLRMKLDVKMKTAAEANRDLVGRCFVCGTDRTESMFPVMKQYVKVISYRSINEYHVACLVFTEHPTYWFDYQSHKLHMPGDWYFGEYVCDTICMENLMASDIRSMTEISNEEFATAARKYLDELLALSFPADHYRFGGKMPTDADWQREGIE